MEPSPWKASHGVAWAAEPALWITQMFTKGEVSEPDRTFLRLTEADMEPLCHAVDTFWAWQAALSERGGRVGDRRGMHGGPAPRRRLCEPYWKCRTALHGPTIILTWGHFFWKGFSSLTDGTPWARERALMPDQGQSISHKGAICCYRGSPDGFWKTIQNPTHPF